MAPLYIHTFVVCLMFLEALIGFEFKAFNWVGGGGGESGGCFKHQYLETSVLV